MEELLAQDDDMTIASSALALVCVYDLGHFVSTGLSKEVPYVTAKVLRSIKKSVAASIVWALGTQHLALSAGCCVSLRQDQS